MLTTLVIPYFVPLSVFRDEIVPGSLQDIVFSYATMPMYFYLGLLVYGLPVSIIIEFITKKLSGIKRDVISFILYVISVIPMLYIGDVYALHLALTFFVIELILRRKESKNYWGWVFVFTVLALIECIIISVFVYNFSYEFKI